MLPAAISCSLGFQTCVRLLVDQRDVGRAALAQRVAEPRGQLEPAGAAADDDDAVPGVTGRCSWSRSSCTTACSLQRARRGTRHVRARPASSTSSGCFGLGRRLVVEHARSCAASSRSPVHLPTTTVATPLPIRLVSARASDMKRSMPEDQRQAGHRHAADRRQRRGQHDEAAAGDAGRALGGQQQHASSSVSCCVSVIGVLVACAMNTAAIVR